MNSSLIQASSYLVQDAIKANPKEINNSFFIINDFFNMPVTGLGKLMHHTRVLQGSLDGVIDREVEAVEGFILEL